ncbi:MAG TPA: hypothetical protein PKW37_03765 [Salinivirgaceae bacterium]|nr:hypothetical protein [Salinivirgaceae bacterium]
MLDITTYGAIDIGSNALRLIITDVYQMPDRVQYKKITLVRVPIRLGEDVFTTGVISENKLNLLTEAISGFSHLIKAYSVKTYRACATSAMREAHNKTHVVNHIEKLTDIKIEIISGEEEARLIHTGGLAEIINDNKTYLYVDVGGGSTEFVLYSTNKKITSKSFPVGTVRTISNAVKPDTVSNMTKWLKKTLQKYPNPTIIGSGGNINQFQKIIENKTGKPIRAKRLRNVRGELSKLTFDERLINIGLSYHRADVIIPALDIFITVMKTVRAKELIVPKIGLGDGIIRQLHRDKIENNHARTT